MGYEEQSFLNGLAAGLSATGGQRLGALRRQLTVGTERIREVMLPEGDFETIVTKIIFRTQEARVLEYEYGLAGEELQKEFRRVGPSEKEQIFYHVWHLPEARPMTEFTYNAYFREPGYTTAFDSYIMAFPYQAGNRTYTYPGSPEAVDGWMTRNLRGFAL